MKVACGTVFLHVVAKLFRYYLFRNIPTKVEGLTRYKALLLTVNCCMFCFGQAN